MPVLPGPPSGCGPPVARPVPQHPPMTVDDWQQALDLLSDLTDHLAGIADDDLDPAARSALWHLGPVRADIVHRIARLEAPGQLTLPGA